MIDLKSILKQHPNCLSSRASFKAILMDTYPKEKRTANILTIMFECGITQKIKSKTEINENELQSLLSQLENDYGIMQEYSSDCVRIWANAFDVSVKAQISSTNIPFKHEPIVHAPIVDNIVVEGSKSDYDVSVEEDYIKINKFVGFDEKIITVPNTIEGKQVKVIGENAFEKCIGIEKVIISEGIKEIQNGAFSGCTSLKEIILPTTLKKIGNTPEKQPGRYYSALEPYYYGVFENCSIEEIQLPSSITYIGGRAFSGCKRLRKINLPNKVEEIREHCFSDCSNLKEVLLPDYLKTIGSFAFAYSGIEKIDIPTSVTKMESYVFCRCEKLNQVLLHEGLNIIGNSVFQECKLLQNITIPKSVTTIGKDVFNIKWGRQGNENLIISCYAGSYGLEYARKEGYKIQNAAK